MTLQEFKKDYYCKLDVTNDNYTVTISTTAIRSKGNQIVDGVKTNYNIQETSDWINDSHSPISINQWDWQKLLDQTKRFHLDYFAQRALIADFYPLNIDENPDIDIYYK
jgi:hypothetical protein